MDGKILTSTLLYRRLYYCYLFSITMIQLPEKGDIDLFSTKIQLLVHALILSFLGMESGKLALYLFKIVDISLYHWQFNIVFLQKKHNTTQNTKHVM